EQHERREGEAHSRAPGRRGLHRRAQCNTRRLGDPRAGSEGSEGSEGFKRGPKGLKRGRCGELSHGVGPRARLRGGTGSGKSWPMSPAAILLSMTVNGEPVQVAV